MDVILIVIVLALISACIIFTFTIIGKWIDDNVADGLVIGMILGLGFFFISLGVVLIIALIQWLTG